MGRKSVATLEAEKREREALFRKEVAEKAASTVAEMLPMLVQQITQQVAAARAEMMPASVPVDAQGVPIAMDLSQPHTPEGDRAFASTLALQIANLASQGTGRAPYVPPERVEAWTEARQRMTALLIEFRAKGGDSIPKYRVIDTCHLNCTRIFAQWHDKANNRMQDTHIWWDEPPNLQMEPLNESARLVYAEYRQSIAELPSQRPTNDVPWVQSDKRLFKGMSVEQRRDQFGLTERNDPRVAGHGAPLGQGSHKAVLGSIAPPAVVK